MDLVALIHQAASAGASDLHLEPGLPVMLRVDGRLEQLGGATTTSRALRDSLRRLVGTEAWQGLQGRGSADLSKTVSGIRCRIALLRSARGYGAAIRLLSSRRVTLDALNLHPSLVELTRCSQGLVLVSGATGSGKSTTVAALVSEINLQQAKHIVTIEQPIEHAIPPVKSLVRQREVGRDTPSFEQGLMDVLREDPDVVVVGEMRWPETIRLTLTAASTGHLVFATVHSGGCGEALARIESAFPANQQPSVRSMLADSLVAVISQDLLWRDDLGIRVPRLEVLRGTDAVRSQVRQGRFFKMGHLQETGADAGMWTRDRYSRWLASKRHWSIPQRSSAASAPSLPEADLGPIASVSEAAPSARHSTPTPAPTPKPASTHEGVLVLDDFDLDPAAALSDLL